MAVRATRLPAGYSYTDPSWLRSIARGSMRVVVDDDTIYIRTPWSTSYDLLQTFDTDYYTNNMATYTDAYLIAKSTSDRDIATAAVAVQIATDSMPDDVCPLVFNGTYIGGNHGANVVVNASVTSHGKTDVDVGSEWTDTNNKKWYILKIVDSGHLWLLSENQATWPTWTFLSSVGGNALTHSAGATHTGSITVSSSALTQLLPITRGHVKTVLAEGTTALTDGVVYACDSLEVRHIYEITDVQAILSYVIANRGTDPAPDWTNASVASAVTVDVTYTFNRNGSCTTDNTVTFNQTVAAADLRIIQAAPATLPSGGSLWEYLPGSNNYATPVDLSTVPAEVLMTATTEYADAENPINRYCQFSKTSGGDPFYGMMIGFYTGTGAAVPATKIAHSTTAGMVSAGTRKTYPILWNNQTFTEGTSVSVTAFRCPLNFTVWPDATCVAWYWVGDDIYLMIDYHEDFDGTLALSADLANKTVTVVESEGDITVGSTTTSAGALSVTVENNYGSLIARLT